MRMKHCSSTIGVFRQFTPRLLFLFMGLFPVDVAGQVLADDEPAAVIDAVMNDFMDRAGATAGTVAISQGDRILCHRAYGFADRRKTVATRDNSVMRIASCTKPVTLAAVEALVAQQKLSWDQSVYEYLSISPASGELGDARIPKISLRHLADHKGGWDRNATFDPLFSIEGIKRELKLQNVGKRQIVRYMWTRPLQFDPGEQYCYSNFGYMLLGMVIEKANGKSYIASLRELVGEPAGIDDLMISNPYASARNLREVDYPAESELDARIHEAAGGIVTSSVSLCRFMGKWWLDGVPREGERNRFFYQIGSHPLTTTALIEQRLDGLNYAILLNARREETYNDDNEAIRRKFNEILDEIGDSLGD